MPPRCGGAAPPASSPVFMEVVPSSWNWWYQAPIRSVVLRRAQRGRHDLRITIYTAEPDTQDAERLPLLSAVATQSLVG
jgi:hypothetical protein